MMSKKAALQLSVNFLVILIICIVIFSSSIYIMRKFFQHAEDIKMVYDERTEKEIERLLDDGSRVAIPFDKKTIYNGEFKTFGIGVLNMLDTSFDNEFVVNISFKKAYNKDNIDLCVSPSHCGRPNTWLQTTDSFGDEGSGIKISRTIYNNEQEKFLVGVGPKDAPSGIYIFDLNVLYINESGDPVEYDTPHKLYVEVP